MAAVSRLAGHEHYPQDPMVVRESIPILSMSGAQILQASGLREEGTEP